eukprot:TRINITY_DN3272_c0_g2_i1.p1 TRINITY_DN3272_c0_g2~~TRINITY_DN3272_c0_g2_i1.p1  ORF type:complete len:499 (+),score=66.94 TRINITY_DN3272_c0_g2_i1:80-1576(+)
MAAVSGAWQGLMLAMALVVIANAAESGSPYFAIRVVDSSSHAGVPLVRLTTSTYITMYTDSAGVAAFDEPGMMNQPVWFSVLADGYVYAQNADPPYDPGVTLVTTPGGQATIELNRTQPGSRVFRLTGAGLYRDSLLTGLPVPPTARARALMDPASKSAAQDTVMTAVYKHRVFWTFGDTVCPSDRRQGNCHNTGMYTVGATSPLPTVLGSPPELSYFGGGGTIHPMAPISPLDRNTWISGLSVVGAGQPNETMYATYIKPSTGGGPDPHEYEGVAVWNQSTSTFEQISRWPNASVKKVSLNGAHAVQLLSPADSGDGYIYYSGSAAYARVAESSVGEYHNYQVLDVNRKWVPVGEAVKTPSQGEGVTLGGGTVNWNSWLGKYMLVADGGDNAVYLGFATQLVGPFVNATMVASHRSTGSSCYNAAHLPHMDSSDGRVIYFACTYTAMWSNAPAGAPKNSWGACLFGQNGSKAGCAAVVPRYEYNNLVYKVDLSTLAP